MGEPSDLARQIAEAVERGRWLHEADHRMYSESTAKTISTSGLADLEGKHAHLETVLDQSRRRVEEFEARLAAAEQKLIEGQDLLDVCRNGWHAAIAEKMVAERERDEARAVVEELFETIKGPDRRYWRARFNRLATAEENKNG